MIGAVFAEWAGSDSGLGHALLTANGQLETARAFAATLLLFVLAVALYGAVRAARAARRGLDAAHRTRRIMTRRVARSPLLALLAVAGCGEKAEPGAAAARARREPFTLMLDYFPNADHAGIYAAQAAGDYDARRARRRRSSRRRTRPRR